MKIAGDTNIYTVRANMDVQPTADNNGIEIHITDDANITYNNYSADISYDNDTGTGSLFNLKIMSKLF